MMQHTNFQLFDAVSDILDYGYAHDENAEINLFNLRSKLLHWGLFEDFL